VYCQKQYFHSEEFCKMSVTMEARLPPRARCMQIVGHTHNSRIFGYHAQVKMAQPRRSKAKDRKHLVMRVQIVSSFFNSLLSICLTAR